MFDHKQDVILPTREVRRIPSGAILVSKLRDLNQIKMLTQ